jgi:hypothetical protein
MNDDFKPFDDAFRDWAARPPETSAPEAAREVAALIRTRNRRRVLRFSAMAAAAMVVAATSAVLLRTPAGSNPEPAVVAEVVQATHPEDGVVLMWLDDETKLYMVFQTSTEQVAPEGPTL